MVLPGMGDVAHRRKSRETKGIGAFVAPSLRVLPIKNRSTYTVKISIQCTLWGGRGRNNASCNLNE